jgi:hypothetical protein
MANWKEIAEEVLRELEWIDDLVYPDEPETQTDTDSDSEEVEEKDHAEIVAEKLLEDYLHLSNFYDRERYELIDAIKKIIQNGDLREYYEIGCMLIYLSERRSVANDLSEYLENF